MAWKPAVSDRHTRWAGRPRPINLQPAKVDPAALWRGPDIHDPDRLTAARVAGRGLHHAVRHHLRRRASLERGRRRRREEVGDIPPGAGWNPEVESAIGARSGAPGRGRDPVVADVEKLSVDRHER